MSVINTNMMSINAQRNLHGSQNALQTSMQRLSSGLRINSAADDAAGLAISKTMQSQVNLINQGIRNANDGISMIQTAEGALEEVQVMLQRMEQLAMQAANATVGGAERGYIADEMNALKAEIDNIADRTTFAGGDSLLDGELGEVKIQLGSGEQEMVQINFGQQVKFGDADAAENPALLGLADAFDFDDVLDGGGDLEKSGNAIAQEALADIKSAIDAVSAVRAEFGAAQNALEHNVSNMRVAAENLEAAKSRILDADFAAETANLTRAQVLQQAGTAMLAQANAAPQSVLSLLQ